MNFSQISLKFWNEDYKNEFIIGQSNEAAIEIINKSDGQIFLCGPEYCGKKHFAYQLSQLENLNVFLIDKMLDASIIAAYDGQIAKGEKALWVSNGILDIYEPCNKSLKPLRALSKDVKSRIFAMERAEIFELSQDMLAKLLYSRMNNIGFVAREEIITYCINRLPLKYYALQMCVEHIKRMNSISFKSFRDFFDQNYINW